jgi:periplasmic protein TonB
MAKHKMFMSKILPQYQYLMLDSVVYAGKAFTQQINLRPLRVVNASELLKLNLAHKAILDTEKSKLRSNWLLFFLVILIHLSAGLWLFMQAAEQNRDIAKPAPIEVAIIVPSVPVLKQAPELVPIVQPVNKPKLKKSIEPKPIEPKPIVEKVNPESPSQQVVSEESVESDVNDTPEPVVESHAAAPKLEKKEAALEPPKFGVAYLNNPPPQYPRASNRNGEQGTVLLRVLVSETGMAETVTIKKSSGYQRLDDAALKVVQTWRFIPARKGEQTLSAYVDVPVSFTLN